MRPNHSRSHALRGNPPSIDVLRRVLARRASEGHPSLARRANGLSVERDAERGNEGKHRSSLLNPRALILGLILLPQLGCLWAAVGVTCAGVAGYGYWQGRDCHAYVADIGDAAKATKTALAELGMTINKEDANDKTAVIKTRATDGSNVTIKLRRETSQIPSEGTITEICIRVGTFGDHPLSGRILYQISMHLLPAMPPGGAPPPPPGTAVMAPGVPPTASGPQPPAAPPGVQPPGGPLPTPRVLPTEPPLAPPGPPAQPPSGPITPASWSPVQTGEPPLSKQ
jgi:Protein of unknown function (DUF3568)